MLWMNFDESKMPYNWPAKRMFFMWSFGLRNFRGFLRLTLMSFSCVGLSYAYFIETGTDPYCWQNLKNANMYYDMLNILFTSFFGILLFFVAVCVPCYSLVLAWSHYFLTTLFALIILFTLVIGSSVCSIFKATNPYPLIVSIASALICTVANNISAHHFICDIKKYLKEAMYSYPRIHYVTKVVKTEIKKIQKENIPYEVAF